MIPMYSVKTSIRVRYSAEQSVCRPIRDFTCKKVCSFPWKTSPCDHRSGGLGVKHQQLTNELQEKPVSMSVTENSHWPWRSFVCSASVSCSTRWRHHALPLSAVPVSVAAQWRQHALLLSAVSVAAQDGVITLCLCLQCQCQLQHKMASVRSAFVCSVSCSTRWRHHALPLSAVPVSVAAQNGVCSLCLCLQCQCQLQHKMASLRSAFVCSVSCSIRWRHHTLPLSAVPVSVAAQDGVFTL